MSKWAIDKMIKVVQDYIYYRKQVVVRIEIRYGSPHVMSDLQLLEIAYGVASRDLDWQ